MRKQKEQQLQKAIVRYMKLQHKDIFMNGSLGGNGYLACVCTGLDETLERIEWYLNCTIPEVDVNYTIKE